MSRRSISTDRNGFAVYGHCQLTYPHTVQHPVEVTITEVVEPSQVQAVLTVNGNTAQHRDIGYPAGAITFKHGSLLEIEAQATKRLPKGWRMAVFSEWDPLNGKIGSPRQPSA